MNDKATFAVKILKQYGEENGVLPRSTSDLSQLEQWLILKLMDQGVHLPEKISSSFTVKYNNHLYTRKHVKVGQPVWYREDDKSAVPTPLQNALEAWFNTSYEY